MQLIHSTEDLEIIDFVLDLLIWGGQGVDFDRPLRMDLQVFNIGRDRSMPRPCPWVCRNLPLQSSSECHSVGILALGPDMTTVRLPAPSVEEQWRTTLRKCNDDSKRVLFSPQTELSSYTMYPQL